MKDQSVAIIIPAYNEARHIKDVLQATTKIHLAKNIIVVSDGSKDKTADIAKKLKVQVIDLKKNKGKGNAARKGCDLAYKQGYEIFILMDADGQHLPEDIPRFLEAIKENDLVFGYRYEGNSPFIYKLGNWGLTMISWILSGMYIKDTQSGFRAFTRKAYKRIKWHANDYFMESEMIFRAKILQCTQIPIQKIYTKTSKGKDKGTTVFTGLKIRWNMIKWKFF